ncbi:MAG: multidrug transporter AcrB [Armatimonadetes bacterium 55-13]|nr:efflux RND transporter permease subunit [Armatimonadota bacterium]OJU62639.1 MAG: multidrug transporter AcrB [Armatimonadetes bacterium 55-13]
MKNGIAGRLASAFIESKLTPLIIIASLLMGIFAVLKTPREEEPQIIVPMADVIVQMPGATAKEVEQRITYPMEKLIWEIPGVEYVYSTSSPGQAMVIVRFLVGQDQERAFVRLREKLQANYDKIPPGASLPIIKARSIDDVPILALTLHSKAVDSFTLRQIAARIEQNIKSVPNVSETAVIGGRKRELRVMLDRSRLSSYHLSSDDVLRALTVSNEQNLAGQFSVENDEIAVKAGEFVGSADDVKNLVVGTSNGKPIHLSSVAEVIDGPEEAKNYVFFGAGPASREAKGDDLEPAVTISVAKRQGVNAIDVVNGVLAKVDTLKGTIIPGDVKVTVTRNYGETSAEKSNELLYHMGIAVVSVTILIALALGRKEALVVLVAIPVTLALTLLVFYLYGFTLNRITLFALIFSIGILVDDAIVVVENIVRHFRMPEAKANGMIQTAIHAVDEVGNPTILATFAVIAAILPMAFVGGLMGPYMRPIPVGASAAMIFSLLIAFIVTPWAAVRILRKGHDGNHKGEGSEDILTRIYRRIMTPLLRSWKVRTAFFGMVGLLFFGAIALVGIKAVTVKMLPFDNKNEFQVIVDMPTGTTLEQTAAVTRALADYGAQVPEVTDYQIYIGTSSPYNFNGLVRHYFTRSAAYQADIQVNLTNKTERKAQSHDIVKRIRGDLAAIAAQYGARIKVAEVPPGPPVLETLVAEVYGPSEQTRLDVGKKIKNIFSTTEGVADVDWYMDDDQTTYRFEVDKEKAALSGVSVQVATQALSAALSGSQVGLLHDEGSREDVPIVARLPRSQRSGLEQLSQINVRTGSGALVSLEELVTSKEIATDKSIYHKNLLPVIYVTGDVVGRQESPVYAILKMNQAIEQMKLPEGVKLNVLSTHLPENTNVSSMKWDGEWHITYEVFRDLGVAFASVLVLIYILVVAWFQDFKTPLVIMAPIPLTLIGILPAHALMGAFFTATSMIGFIAGAGIIVRNSIILVDFIELRRREGSTLEQAVVDAGAIRFRPMLLTASAVIVGSFVILFDPIFQGLAIALMAGEIASTLLSRLAVPVLYFLSESRSVKNQV